MRPAAPIAGWDKPERPSRWRRPALTPAMVFGSRNHKLVFAWWPRRVCRVVNREIQSHGWTWLRWLERVDTVFGERFYQLPVRYEKHWPRAWSAIGVAALVAGLAGCAVIPPTIRPATSAELMAAAAATDARFTRNETSFKADNAEQWRRIGAHSERITRAETALALGGTAATSAGASTWLTIMALRRRKQHLAPA